VQEVASVGQEQTPAEAEQKEEQVEHVPQEQGVVDVGMCTHIGAGDPPIKSENQDVVHVIKKQGLTVAIMLDGHGQYGLLLAQVIGEWFQENAPATIEAEAPQEDEAWGRCITQLFENCNESLKSHPRIGFRNKMSGATASILFIQGGRMHVGHVGDSRVILAESKSATSLSHRALTIDHRPDEPQEMARIQASGGLVRSNTSTDANAPEVGPKRVWLPPEKNKEFGFSRPVPGLMLSRSIGDEVSKAAGCSCVPDVFHATVTSKHKFLIVASDGVW
jgi:serine/threonine protein phosphatase PrpC